MFNYLKAKTRNNIMIRSVTEYRIAKVLNSMDKWKSGQIWKLVNIHSLFEYVRADMDNCFGLFENFLNQWRQHSKMRT